MRAALLRRVAVPLLAVALLTACGGSTEVSGDQAAAALAALPACDPAPAPAAELVDVEGLVLPEGAVVTEVTPQGPLTEVSGYVAMTPLDVRAWFEAADAGGSDDMDLVTVEDEVFESELLVASGDRRMYLKALALCDQGSGLEATVAPAGEADELPTPEGRDSVLPSGT